MYSIGFVIDERIIVSGDTQWDPEMITEVEPAGGAEHIFHDTQFYPGGIHASLDQIAQLPEEIRRSTSLADLAFAGFVRQGVIYEF